MNNYTFLFENLKSLSRGYGSFDYEIIGEKESKLKKLDIMIAGEQVDALSIIVHKDNAYKQGSSLCKKLKNEINDFKDKDLCTEHPEYYN